MARASEIPNVLRELGRLREQSFRSVGEGTGRGLDIDRFDDTYEHEVRNDTPDRRVVLFVDFDRPMDGIGSLINRLLVYMIKVSNYVQVPLKNLADWNKELPKTG